MTTTQHLTKKVLAPAKLNLFLYVTGKRPDGYHDLCTLFTKISLYDELTLTVRPGSGVISMTCSAPELSVAEDNLCIRAARLFLKRLNNEPVTKPKQRLDVSIHLDKRIPLGAGLGGGSSNAASVLSTLNEITGKPVTDQVLMELGGQIGSDVPFFLLPQTSAVGTGKGTRLEPCKIEPMWFLLLWPGFSISTRWVYKALVLTKQSKSHIFQALFRLDEVPWQNDLEAAVMPAYPILKELKRVLRDAGAEKALLSGSGSTVYGVFRDRQRTLAAQEQLAEHPIFQQNFLQGLRNFIVQSI